MIILCLIVRQHVAKDIIVVLFVLFLRALIDLRGQHLILTPNGISMAFWYWVYIKSSCEQLILVFWSKEEGWMVVLALSATIG